MYFFISWFTHQNEGLIITPFCRRHPHGAWLLVLRCPLLYLDESTRVMCSHSGRGSRDTYRHGTTSLKKGGGNFTSLKYFRAHRYSSKRNIAAMASIRSLGSARGRTTDAGEGGGGRESRGRRVVGATSQPVSARYLVFNPNLKALTIQLGMAMYLILTRQSKISKHPTINFSAVPVTLTARCGGFTMTRPALPRKKLCQKKS